MKTILLEQYMQDLATMESFYRYSDYAFKNEQLKEEITKAEIKVMVDIAMPYVKGSPGEQDKVREIIQVEVTKNVSKAIENGLATLRRQLLEAAHSVFEKYLCHVVRVYLHTFPEILYGIDKEIPFRTVAQLKDNESIFNHIIEKEVGHFSYRSLQEKKQYCASTLKHTGQETVWVYKGQELWKDIDKKRQAIVHEDELPEVSFDYLSTAILYFQHVMVGMAMNAQADQGVPFKWAMAGEYVKKKELPSLR